jgi:hypothetical protein
MKFIFGMILIFWGIQLILESFFGLYIPFFRLLMPFAIIAWGIYLLQKPDWGSISFPFYSEMKISNSENLFLLDQLKQKHFAINHSNCTFDGSMDTRNTLVEIWITAKKSRLAIICNSDVHTIVYLSLNRSSVHYSDGLSENKPFEDRNNTIHVGKTDQKPTVFFHIKAKESIIALSEK